MPWTIYRYILLDVIRLLLMATVALVVVIALAIAVKELQEGLLGAVGLVKFIGYTMPTTIVFALPFAAAFAGTMVFTRLVADNELTAIRAGGIGYVTILLPLVFLGIVLTMSLFHLSNWVIPTFYKAAQRMVEQDVIQMLVNQLSRGQAFKRQNMVLYADGVHDGPPPPGLAAGMNIEPQRLIVLQGVAVGQIDDSGKLRSDTTAERADVLVYRARGQTWVKIRLLNTLYFDATAQRNGAFSQSLSLQEIALPNPLRHREKFLSWPELRELDRKPELYDAVAKQKRALVAELARHRILTESASALGAASGRGLSLRGSGSQEYYVIRPASVVREGALLRLQGSASQPIRIDYFANGQVMHHYQAESGTLHVETDGEEPRLQVELQTVQVQDARLSDRRTQRQVLRLPWMRWHTPLLNELDGRTTSDLLGMARQSGSRDEPVYQAGQGLVRSIDRLGRRVTAQLHDRAASAIGCTLVLILSALLSMNMRGRMPLVVYFWSFLLAALSVVIIQGGGQIATDVDGSLRVGLGVIWSGNVMLLLACLGVYWRLSRT